jgi:cytoskeletal protein RodZ
MQFEEFDKKIKEAAGNHHPAYDEKAWRKMENLLDKHMPREKDDRRRFLFILLLFLVLGGTGLLIAKPWKGRKIVAATEQTVQKKQAIKDQSTLEKDKEETKKENGKTLQQDDTNTTSVVENNKPDFAQTISKTAADLPRNIAKINSNRLPGIQNNTFSVKTKPAQTDADNKWWQGNDLKDKPANKQMEGATALNKINLVNNDVNTDKKQNEEDIIINPMVLNDLKPAINDAAKNTESKNEILTVKQNTEKKEKVKTKKQHSFFLSISTGPDVSFVNNGKPGTAKIFGGGGLGYTFNNRFTFRTGFYSGRKVYTASPEAYHPPDIFYVYYPYLEKVDADCKIYEIPLSISYHFSKSSNRSFFASAGISSYLMKSEKYNYTYKYYSTGPTVYKQWAIKNQNKHFFSGITLSGGYQQNLNKHLTLIIEPYLKLPLTGIGYGKVKLNSGGVIFTVGVKPFK